MTVHSLDGRAITAVASYTAYGCGGLAEADAAGPDGDRSVFVLWGDRTGDLDQLETTLAGLRPGAGGRTSGTQRTLLADLGYSLPDAPGPEPVWDATWPGTRGEYETAHEEWVAQRRSHDEEMGELLDQARVRVLLDAGGIPVEVYPPRIRRIVYDYGCRCGHRETSTGVGLNRFAVDGDRLFLVADGVDLQTALADVETVRVETFARAHARNVSELAQIDVEDLPVRPLDDEVGRDLSGLRFGEWTAHRSQQAADARVQLTAAVAAEDWERVRALAGYRLRSRLVDPARVAAAARARALDEHGIRAVTVEDVSALTAALPD